VLGALATGASIAQASRRAGVHRSTVHDWINRSNLFVAQLNQLKCERLDSLRTEMHSLSSAAVDALRNILTSSETPAPTRLQAALALLDSLGALESNPIGPTDPRAVSDARFLNQVREEFPRLF
jgi:transposase-like protein